MSLPRTRPSSLWDKHRQKPAQGPAQGRAASLLPSRTGSLWKGMVRTTNPGPGETYKKQVQTSLFSYIELLSFNCLQTSFNRLCSAEIVALFKSFINLNHFFCMFIILSFWILASRLSFSFSFSFFFCRAISLSLSVCSSTSFRASMFCWASLSATLS